MNGILSMLIALTQYPGSGINYDVAIWPVFVFGGLVIIGISVVIAVIVFFIVKYLKRQSAKNKTNNA